MATLKIIEIKVKAIADEYPDLSWLGEYSNKYEENAIDVYEKEGEDHRKLQFFHPANPEYAEEDYKRMKAYNAGEWGCVGIQAEATVAYEIGGGCKRLEQLTSGGLWGIESDSGEYLKEVANEELKSLKDHLEAFNVDTSNFEELSDSLEIIYE